MKELTKEKYESLFIEHGNLRHRLDQLERLVFGSRHERFIPTTSPQQLSVGINTPLVQHLRLLPRPNHPVNKLEELLPVKV